MTPERLVPLESRNDIPADYRDTPIGKLIEYHNLGLKFEPCEKPEIVIGMCMDYRKSLRKPNKFAFILRDGGANFRFSEFKISFAIALGGVKYMALIGHSQCGMINLGSKREQFVNGLVENAGWERKNAESYFHQHQPTFDIEDEIDFITAESRRLSLLYPKVQVVPLYYKVEDHKLYAIRS